MTTENKEALLPCPFCGACSDDIGICCDLDVRESPERGIRCYGCNVEAPFYPSEAEAIAAWNRRSQVTGEAAPAEGADTLVPTGHALGEERTWRFRGSAGDAGARMLTHDEISNAYDVRWEDHEPYPKWVDRMYAVLNKFCSVNNIRLAGDAACLNKGDSVLLEQGAGDKSLVHPAVPSGNVASPSPLPSLSQTDRSALPREPSNG